MIYKRVRNNKINIQDKTNIFTKSKDETSNLNNFKNSNNCHVILI